MKHRAAIRAARATKSKAPTGRGFAMLLVMILVATGVVLGFTYLSSASLKVTIANNYRELSRARYLAESGLEHALYTLRYMPENIENAVLGPFYADTTSDHYYVYAQPVPGSKRLYRLTSVATVGGVQRSSSTTVERSPGATIEVDQGMLVGSGLAWLPWSLRINGDIHVNGSLFNMAQVNGDVSATGGVSDPWWRVNGDTDAGAEAEDMPKISINPYLKYSLTEDDEYRAKKYKMTNVTAGSKLADGKAVTKSNPAGVVQVKPERNWQTVTLHDNFDFTGTLIVDGDLILDGSNIELKAMDGFPALIVTGRVYVTNSARNVTITGLVSAKRGMTSDGWTPNASTTINGAIVSTTGGYDVGLYGNHTLNYDPDRATVFDMNADVGDREPQVTVVDWND